MGVTPTVERYVQALRGKNGSSGVVYDRDGFLDLEAQPDIHPASDLAGVEESFVLLAPGGVGKTTVLRELSDREGGTWLDLATRTPAETRVEIAAARADGRPRYFDAIDQVARLQPSTLRVLRHEFPADAAMFRLGCRPGAWDAGFPESVARYRLLPLTRDAARTLLDAVGVAEEFLGLLVRADLGRLSATPLVLLAVAQQWQVDGRLPSNRDEALDQMVELMLAERAPEYGSQLSADLRRRVAGRLAAVATFSETTRFAASPVAARATAAADQLPSRPEPDRPDTPITPNHHREVLATSLFHAADDGTVAFLHQEYAEYLAARYVIDRKPVNRQIETLLGAVDGVVPTHMINVAAWIASRRPEYADVLLPRNAVALARAEAYLSPPVRSRVVAALLDEARNAAVEPLWALDLEPLVHHGLEDQLTTELDAGTTDLGSWWVCRLALAGRCHGLVPRLIRFALDPSLRSWTRRPAIAAVARLGTDDDRARLRPLLELDAESDSDDELFAAVIHEFYLRELDTEALLAMLRPPRDEHFFGAYNKFLWELPGRVPDADLPLLRAWWGQGSDDLRRMMATSMRERLRPDEQRAIPSFPASAAEPAVPVEPVVDEELATRVKSALDEVRAASGRWWKLCAALARSNHGLFSADLTRRPGWTLFTDDERSDVLDWGTSFLVLHEPSTERWAGLPRAKSKDLLPHHAGVYLLATLAEYFPNRFAAVEYEVLARWTPCIASAWCVEGRDLLGRLAEKMPPDLQQEIAKALCAQIEVKNREDATFNWAPLHDALIQQLMPTLTANLRSGSYRAELATSLLHEIVRLQPDEAAALCRDLATSPLGDIALSHLARLDPSGTVDRLGIDLPIAADPVRHINPAALDDERLHRLAFLLFDRFPMSEDPPFEGPTGPEYEVRSVRNGTVEQLMDRALVRRLEDLAVGRDTGTLFFINRSLQRARQLAADSAIAHLTPDQLLVLLGRSDARLVRDDGELAVVVLEHLAAMRELISRGAHRDVWKGDKPLGEDDVSDWVQRQLSPRLGDPGLVDREVQVERRAKSGMGTRMDLTATVSTATASRAMARVTIEAKLDTNRGLDGAMRAQLVDSYLRPTGHRHGIYLVYWTGLATRWPTPAALRAHLEGLATQLAPAFEIFVLVLDLTPPVTIDGRSSRPRR